MSRGRTVILVDDGLATGSTMRAAALRCAATARPHWSWPCRSRRRRPARSSAHEVDGSSAPCTPEPFYAVGLWYEDFSQTTDEEVALQPGLGRWRAGADAPSMNEAADRPGADGRQS